MDFNQNRYAIGFAIMAIVLIVLGGICSVNAGDQSKKDDCKNSANGVITIGVILFIFCVVKVGSHIYDTKTLNLYYY
jgi:hypothetical protein